MFAQSSWPSPSEELERALQADKYDVARNLLSSARVSLASVDSLVWQYPIQLMDVMVRCGSRLNHELENELSHFTSLSSAATIDFRNTSLEDATQRIECLLDELEPLSEEDRAISKHLIILYLEHQPVDELCSLLEKPSKIQAFVQSALNTPDLSGKTLFHRWVFRTAMQDVRRQMPERVWLTCLNLGADVMQPTGDPLIPTYFFAACATGAPLSVIQALLQAGVDVSTRAATGRTPLLAACSNMPRLDVVTALLAAGADPTSQDNEGDTPLTLVCSREQGGGTALVQLLLDAGAPHSTANNWGDTPLFLACSGASAVGTLLRIAAGADSNTFRAVATTMPLPVGIPLSDGLQPPEESKTRLAVACHHLPLPAVEALLQAGAGPIVPLLRQRRTRFTRLLFFELVKQQPYTLADCKDLLAIVEGESWDSTVFADLDAIGIEVPLALRCDMAIYYLCEEAWSAHPGSVWLRGEVGATEQDQFGKTLDVAAARARHHTWLQAVDLGMSHKLLELVCCSTDYLQQDWLGARPAHLAFAGMPAITLRLPDLQQKLEAVQQLKAKIGCLKLYGRFTPRPDEHLLGLTADLVEGSVRNLSSLQGLDMTFHSCFVTQPSGQCNAQELLTIAEMLETFKVKYFCLKRASSKLTRVEISSISSVHLKGFVYGNACYFTCPPSCQDYWLLVKLLQQRHSTPGQVVSRPYNDLGLFALAVCLRELDVHLGETFWSSMLRAGIDCQLQPATTRRWGSDDSLHLTWSGDEADAEIAWHDARPDDDYGDWRRQQDEEARYYLEAQQERDRDDDYGWGGWEDNGWDRMPEHEREAWDD